MKPQGHIPPSASPSAHEGADIHLPTIVRVAVALAVVLALSIFILALFFWMMEREYPKRTSEAAPVVTPTELPPVPRTETHPRLELAAVRQLEDSHLDHYGWVDRPHGVAQIPVDRAMVLWVRDYAATPPPASIPASTTPKAPKVRGTSANRSASPPSTPPAVPAAGTTELQMRQEKARKNADVP